MDNKVFRCECGAQYVAFEWDVEDKNLYASFYELYGKSVDDWKQRLRHCCKILRTGLPYTDSVILSQEDAKKLHEYLSGCF